MKTLARAIGTLVLILFGILANGSAMAQHRYGHGHNHGPVVRFGFSYGFPIYGPGYFPAPYYTYPGYVVPAPAYVYPPAVIVNSSPPVYVERSITQTEPAPSQTQNDWYYCAGSQTYYPYTKHCPGGWQRVPAQPSPR
ncbi:MAG: hypothetical protein FIA96_06015 [Betaproteobacteria bacterium]|jgi:hypothetical protein|nr:hypothetical protein [Betaproteobacteria bacterium]